MFFCQSEFLSGSTTIWANFKLFGMLGLTVLFIVLQTLYLSRYITEPGQEKSDQ